MFLKALEAFNYTCYTKHMIMHSLVHARYTVACLFLFLFQMFSGGPPFGEGLPPSFAELVEPATAELAVHSRGEAVLSNSAGRCGCCLRAEIPGRPIGLTTLAREGTLYRACTSCFLICELQAAVTDGQLSLAEEQVGGAPVALQFCMR